MSEYYRPSAFPPVVKNLIIINALVFFAQTVFGASHPEIEQLFALHEIHSFYFKPWQPITYMFLHGGFDHILFNMLALWMFGSLLENTWGARRFLFFYLATGLGAALLHMLVLNFEFAPLWDYIRRLPADQQAEVITNPRLNFNSATLGASGAVFGCLAAFGYLFPNSLIYMYLLIPIKAKWFVLIYGAVELWLGVRNSAGDNVAHFAHLGGAVVGLILVIIWKKSNRRTLY